MTYSHADNGNIASVVQDGVTTAYTYDALGQLIRVDDGQENATWVYTYDMGGNILSKKKYALGNTTGEPLESKVFTYGNANWRDQLTAVDGVAITYDAIGNPLNDGEWTYTWQNGRQLASMTNGTTTANFVYNENGLRVQKTVNGVVTDYTLHGKNVVHMKQGSDELHFFYDAQNKPAVVVYNGTPYSYVKNLQGDIVAILNSAGTVVVSYVYDAWGRPISKTGSMVGTLGTVQPFRYRSYVFDEETELYYLRSRYYNPVVQRFVSQDSSVGQKQLLRHSLYAYCRNEPVRHRDASGREDEDISFADLIVGTPWAEEYFYGKSTPKCENGHYYVITPHTHRAGVYIESSDGAGTVLGATAYRYNQSSGKPEYYVGRYENGYFYLNCEGVHGRSEAEFYEVIYDDDVGEAEYRYGHPTLVESSQTHVAYISIENLQRDLILLNYSIDGDVYGFYGAGTRKAVEAFQRENGLQDDGKAGTITKRTLLQCVKDHVVW